MIDFRMNLESLLINLERCLKYHITDNYISHHSWLSELFYIKKMPLKLTLNMKVVKAGKD